MLHGCMVLHAACCAHMHLAVDSTPDRAGGEVGVNFDRTGSHSLLIVLCCVTACTTLTLYAVHPPTLIGDPGAVYTV